MHDYGEEKAPWKCVFSLSFFFVGSADVTISATSNNKDGDRATMDTELLMS
jgi:hypothetical protein